MGRGEAILAHIPSVLWQYVHVLDNRFEPCDQISDVRVFRLEPGAANVEMPQMRSGRTASLLAGRDGDHRFIVGVGKRGRQQDQSIFSDGERSGPFWIARVRRVLRYIPFHLPASPSYLRKAAHVNGKGAKLIPAICASLNH